MAAALIGFDAEMVAQPVSRIARSPLPGARGWDGVARDPGQLCTRVAFCGELECHLPVAAGDPAATALGIR